MKLDLSHRGLTTLEGIDLPEGLTDLRCYGNRLTSLPKLPSSLKLLNCEYNRLEHLSDLPPSLTVLICNGNRLTSLPSLPSSLTELFCTKNQLINLPRLPPTLKTLMCQFNLLTSLPDLPSSLTLLTCRNNEFPKSYFWRGSRKPISELRLTIRVERLCEGIWVISRLVQDRMARNIQRCWRRYWLVPYFDERLGYEVSRYMLHYHTELSGSAASPDDN